MRIPLLTLALLVPGVLLADDPPKSDDEPIPSQEELIKKLEKDLTGAKLVGRFTVTGKDDMTPKEEEYTITSAMKLTDPDLWMIKARVKYGKKDGVFPIPILVKWAGDTPIITMTNMEIPGLGTFSTRVIIYEGRYAGTWQHGDVGGHLFGVIKRDEPETEEKK
jgi:hypothetical protein